jgi:dihydrofolate reductase
MIVSIIVAVAENNVIGQGNRLIWHISEDLKRFKNLTTGHHIIMGRKTFESIGKALPNRTNVVISRNSNLLAPGYIVVDGLQKALDISKEDTEVFIIGGGEIYKQALPLADKIYLTKVEAKFEGDTFFPPINHDEWLIESIDKIKPTTDGELEYSFINLVRKNS